MTDGPIKREKCPQCGGSGRTSIMPRCPGCLGKGWIASVEPGAIKSEPKEDPETIIAALNQALTAAHLELAAIKNALADVMRERDEAQRAHVRVQYENLTHRASHEALERLVESATDRWDPELHAYVLRVSKDQWEHVKALLGDVVSGPKLNL